jgi:PAP2 superfamily protein
MAAATASREPGGVPRPMRLVAMVLDRFERLDGSQAARGRVGGGMRVGLALLFVASALAGTVRALSGGGLPGPSLVLLLMFAAVLMMNRIGRFLRDWSPVLVILFLYLVGFTLVQRFHMPVFYRPQFDADRLIGLGQLPTLRLQHAIGTPPTWLGAYAVGTYLTHFFFPLLVGFYLWWRRSEGFTRLMYADIVVSALACVTTVLAPTAPPWLAAEHGLAPGVHDVLRHALTQIGLNDLAHYKGDAKAYNTVAAFPSIHAAFPVLGLIALVRYRAPRWAQAAQLGQLLSVWFVIVWTGEHYVVDIVGGVAYAAISWVVVSRLATAIDRSRVVSPAMEGAVVPPMRPAATAGD